MIYFISGHRNITDEEFQKHYVPQLDEAISGEGHFVVGDYYGVDHMAQKYLKGKVPDYRVTVYHMLEAPRNYVEGFNKKGGYPIDEERDAAMTRDSHVDIAWSRSELSGTARNLRRRKEDDRMKWLEFMEAQLTHKQLVRIREKYESTVLDKVKETNEGYPQIEMSFSEEN